MSSLVRRWQRKRLRALPDYEAAPQQYRPLRDGGYMVLHATKGWRRVSGKRVRAGFA